MRVHDVHHTCLRSPAVDHRSIRRSTVLTRMTMTAVTVAVAALVTLDPVSARAAESPAQGSVTVPTGASTVWVDVDTDGAVDLSASVKNAGGWQSLDLHRTAFGYGAVVPAVPGTMTVRLTSTAEDDPDLSLTAVDETGLVVAASTERVTLVSTGTDDQSGDDEAAGPPAGGDDQAGGGGADAVSSTDDPTPRSLAFTGASIGGAALAAAALVGAGIFLLRRKAAVR